MQCPRCAGSGTCPECKGQGAQECPACSGAGTRETTRGYSYPCKACGGQGHIACPLKCSSCEGTGEITEELQKKARDTYTVRFSNFTPSSQVTGVLLTINLAMYLLGSAEPRFHELTILRGDVILTGYYWEFLGSLFQHASIFHLLANMSFLWNYGPVLEGLLGKSRYLVLYLGAGIVGSVVSYFGNSYFSGLNWSVTGASGALFGIDGALLALYWRWRVLPWEPVRSLTMWAALILIGGVAAQLNGLVWLDNWSHAGGFLGGFIIAVMLGRPRGR